MTQELASKGRVLVVDDDASLAEMLSIVLRQEGFDTRVCARGDQALAEFRAYRPDVLLLDLMLPGKDGIEVCREIRAESDVPVVMLTAKTDTVDVVLGLESGADDYIMKPFKPKELVARIRARLRRSDQQTPEFLQIGDVTIDVPGHSQAAIHAYPELGEAGEIPVGTRWGIFDEVLAVTDHVLEFYKNVFDELIELFPSTYVHVGGDECPKTQWRTSASAQQRIKDEGLADEDELQSWFIRQLDDHLTERGRRLLGWDEILEGGLAPGATVMSWRGEEGGIAAARAGHDVVMAPTATSYLDYKQSEGPDEPVPVGTLLRLQDVYAGDPVPADLTETEAQHVLGAQVNLWSEHVDTPRRLDYMVFPRLSAFAEKVWSRGDRDYTEFEPRLKHHLKRLDAIGVEYRPLDVPRPWHTRPGVRGWG